MRNVAFHHRVSLWLFAIAVYFVGMSLGVVSSWAAPEHDHLECYTVTDSNKPKKEDVSTDNVQFGTQDCKVTKKAKQICAPTIKDNGDDARAGAVSAQDYLCYNVTCKPRHKKTVHVVDDQFGNRLMRVNNSKTICTPALKSPPLECGGTAPQCDGLCPANTKCTVTTIENESACFCK